MKKFLVLILLGLLSSAARSEQPSEALEKVEKEIKALYPGFQELSYLQLMNTDFTRRLGDFHSTYQSLLASILMTTGRLNDLNQTITKELGSEANQAWSEKKLLSLEWTRHASARLFEEASAQSSAVDRFTTTFNRRCEAPYKDNFLVLFDPKLLFPRDNFGMAMPAHVPSFEVSMKYDLQNQRTGYSFNTNDEVTAAIVGGATAAGCIIGSIIPGVGNALGATIGFLVGTVAAALRNVFIKNSEIHKQIEIRERTRSFMISSADNLAAKREKLYDDQCQLQLNSTEQQEILETLALLKQRSQALQISTQKLNQGLQSQYENFPAQLQEHLATVRTQYLNQLALGMRDAQASFLNDLLQVDEQSFRYVTEEVSPNFSRQNAMTSAYEKLQVNQNLWQQQILGDILFSQTNEGIKIEDSRAGFWKESADEISEKIRSAL